MASATPKRRFKLKHITALAITAVVLAAIFVPFQQVQAFTLRVNISPTVVESTAGEDFTINLQVQPGELISFETVRIVLDEEGPGKQICTFDKNKNAIGSCDLISNFDFIVSPGATQTNGYAYGYGLVSDGPAGSGYVYTNGTIGNNVYSYVYSYGLTNYVYGYVGPANITFSGKLQTHGLSLGTHTLRASVATGAAGQNSYLNSPPQTFVLTSPSITVFVDSKTTANASLPGMFMNVVHGTGISPIIVNGTTPTSFSNPTLVIGQTYTIYANDFGGNTFDHWQSDISPLTSTSRGYTFIATSGTVHLVAVYSQASLPIADVFIKAVDDDLNPLAGAVSKITVGANPPIATSITGSSGISSYPLVAGNHYNVTISNPGKNIFDHWSTPGGTVLSYTRTYDFTATDGMELRAVFKPAPGSQEFDVSLNAGDKEAIINLGGGKTLKITFDNNLVSGGILRVYKFTQADILHFLGLSPSGSLFFATGGSNYDPISDPLEIDASGIGLVGGATLTLTVDGDLTNAKFLHFNGLSWDILSTSIDSSSHTVSGHTPGFSLFAVGKPGGGSPGPAPNSSGGGGGSTPGFINLDNNTAGPGEVPSEVRGVENWTSYKLVVDGKEYTIQYTITNGTVTSMTLDTGKAALSVAINTTADGNLQLRLPRAVIDSKTGANGTSGDDKPFAVLVGDKVVTPQEAAAPSADMRQISIDFTNGTQKIDIMGTMAIPEFGTIAAIVMAIAILGVILATMRYSNRFNFRRL